MPAHPPGYLERRGPAATPSTSKRWIKPDGSTLDAIAAKAFFPFGAGPQFCPGRFLALLEIKGVISMLCRNFEFERAGSGPVEEKLVFTMRPDNLVTRLKRRAGAPPAA
ncbi:cytochrome P450 [Luteimonas marina]|nr:cytochrome P450 [Luteimonas marina]